MRSYGFIGHLLAPFTGFDVLYCKIPWASGSHQGKYTHFLFSKRVIPPFYLKLHQEGAYLLNGDHDSVELIGQHAVDRVV